MLPCMTTDIYMIGFNINYILYNFIFHAPIKIIICLPEWGHYFSNGLISRLRLNPAETKIKMP